MIKYKILKFLWRLFGVKYMSMQHDTYRTVIWERKILDDGTIKWKKHYELKNLK